VIAAMIASVTALLAVSRRMAIYAGIVGFIAVTLFLNRSWPLHQAVIFLSLMFTGTVIFRAASGQISVKLAWITVPLVAICDTIAFRLYFQPWGEAGGTYLGGTWWTESVAAVAAIGIFLIAHALRDRVRWPEPLQWLGRISYSVYLVHWVVMMSVPALPAEIPAHGVLTLLMWVAITLGVSQLTYTFVERPAVDLGRRVALWARHRYDLKPSPSVAVIRPQQAQPAARELV
jgi:peptidoglycan/LPS O-acetylase OafA/YrhL